MSRLAKDGWRLVARDGGTFVTGVLFNVVTGEDAHVVLADFERWDPFEGREDAGWYDAVIDNDARREWCRVRGVIADGVTARVVKGRKVPIGFTGKVARVRKVYDRYDRWVANYAVFEDGTETNVNNCVLVD